MFNQDYLRSTWRLKLMAPIPTRIMVVHLTAISSNIDDAPTSEEGCIVKLHPPLNALGVPFFIEMSEPEKIHVQLTVMEGAEPDLQRLRSQLQLLNEVLDFYYADSFDFVEFRHTEDLTDSMVNYISEQLPSFELAS